MKDFGLIFKKIAIKSCLGQQMTEKFAVEVDAKFVLGISIKICKYLYLMRMFKGFPIIQESFMTLSEDWQMAFRYSTLPGKHCMCQNLLQSEYEP